MILINKFANWLTKGLNEDIQDYSYIDGFCIDNELTEEEIEKIQNANYKVVPEVDYKALIDDRDKLCCLQMYGVDNWQGYGMAMEEYYKGKVE
ncbi:MAG: hypothetical protein ACLFUH_05835 [Bacteroidales bacterium]